MSSLYPYDKMNGSEWLNQLNNEKNIENTIDYFFTQRKVTEYDETIDEKTLERKKKKNSCMYNFLAINFPTTVFKGIDNLSIDIEIWGDEKFNFKGNVNKLDGEMPHLLLKLKDDKTLFVKLIFKDHEKVLKTFISFIPVIKRYQVTPDTVIETSITQ
jgi:hypothetical protein